MIKVMIESDRPYAEVKVGMKWSDDEFTKTCTKIVGDKAYITETWGSLDSDDINTDTTVYDIVKGDTCDILKDPTAYEDSPYGTLYVSSAYNFDDFYPDYFKTLFPNTFGEGVIYKDDELKEAVDLADDIANKIFSAPNGSITGYTDDGPFERAMDAVAGLFPETPESAFEEVDDLRDWLEAQTPEDIDALLQTLSNTVPEIFNVED